jgi:myo-inositol 2-dehydrogenase / D-chiro-inositol 1-dehydrogenase
MRQAELHSEVTHIAYFLSSDLSDIKTDITKTFLTINTMKKTEQSRRKFLSTMAMGTVGTLGASKLFASNVHSGRQSPFTTDTTLSLLEKAPDGPVLKAGLVGCGGRGTGAVINFLDAGPNLEIIALGDVFPDQLSKCRTSLRESRCVEIADENCFTGFDSYQKVIDSGVDIVLFATPPYFRPQHVKAAIEAGKHVFQEKPVAVDPYGARIMDEVSQKAKEKNLCMVSGTARRYAKDLIETQRRVDAGEIGEVVSANVLRNGGALWWVERRSEWSDLEYMLRNWGNFAWLSGDHIVEMFIHEIDLMSWHLGSHPERAVGYGGRQQRISGDQYDQFSIVYDYGSGKKVHCGTRQINGLGWERNEMITGTKGYADPGGSLYNFKDELIWEYPYPADDADDQTWRVNNPFVQEHVELITAIRTGNYLNDSDEQIKSNRICIMGRMAAYTGRVITWEEVLTSDLRLGPDVLDFSLEYDFPEKPPVVGTAPTPVNRYA